jgi:hypothetical protein
MQSNELRAGRIIVSTLLQGLVAAELIGAAYLCVDAAGAFDLPAGRNPGSYWLVVLAFLGLVVTPLVCTALSLAPFRSIPFAWLLAPACAVFFFALTFSFDHSADGYVPRNSDEHPFLVSWAIGIGIGALAVGWLTTKAPRAGIALTGLVAIACLLPMIGMALAGH